jgi:hypothetical protein
LPQKVLGDFCCDTGGTKRGPRWSHTSACHQALIELLAAREEMGDINPKFNDQQKPERRRDQS